MVRPSRQGRQSAWAICRKTELCENFLAGPCVGVARVREVRQLLGLDRSALPCGMLAACSVRFRRVIGCKVLFYARAVLGGCCAATKCRFAHSEEERRAKPDLTCTRMCHFAEKGP